MSLESREPIEWSELSFQELAEAAKVADQTVRRDGLEYKTASGRVVATVFKAQPLAGQQNNPDEYLIRGTRVGQYLGSRYSSEEEAVREAERLLREKQFRIVEQ